MTVYVDNARILATVGRTRGRWSHLTADTEDELHTFAAQLGLLRAWYQRCKTRCGPVGAPCVHWHYDVTDPVRARAVALGAVQIDMGELGALITARRAALRAATTGEEPTP